MKYIYILIFSLLFLSACSNEDFPDEVIQVPDIENNFPSIPGLVFPTNNLVCTNFNLEFKWSTVIDIDGDAIAYQIDLAYDNTFSNILFSVTTSEPTWVFTLEKGTTYFWRVKAIDSEQNESEYSEVQSFFTEPEAGVNTIPYGPEIISPALRTTVSGSAVTLDWSATDADQDPLLFDVYFGDVNPPPLVSENLQGSTFDVNISSDTTYYWRVVVKDDKQGVAIGRVWNFNTN
ncbi:hypothetical protein [Aquimarina sp. 2201CG5-10]|uniref:hypothetical protein n=1 Tax=Aquimarina callyspongiae TaxID=3098150 RepID=UPI002AB354CC|nr:hypothetical protein [Aquimarina sp. 2201CG5-10]MDY8134885.1 hypothetical protein [Aquimarina sp. 2201CG5-10]